ncbi:MAG: hypothetical protein K8F25_06890, partial [Fimbriimonadaceae bacterium]|nr:hypothetical protein [Alphaproteobacteria bacterium]
MSQTIAMNVRTPQPDLAAITRAAQDANLNDYQLRNAPLKSELEGLQLQDEIGGQRAMQGYRGAMANDDPSALDNLKAYPKMQKEMYEAFDGMSPKEFMDAKKRSTAFVNAAKFVGTLDGSKDQTDRWNASAHVLKEKGFIDDKQFKMMIDSGPNDLMIQQAHTADQWLKAYGGKNANSLDDEYKRAQINNIDAD